MKHHSYFDRAMKAADRRYRRIFEKMGYGSVEAPGSSARDPDENLDELRSKYQRTTGKKPFHGWDAETLRNKLAAFNGEGN